MKKNIEKHYISKDKKTNIYIKFYTTKSGFLKFHIQIKQFFTANRSSGQQVAETCGGFPFGANLIYGGVFYERKRITTFI